MQSRRPQGKGLKTLPKGIRLKMCGFVAEIRFDEQTVSEESLRSRARLIHHRGPDDEGYYSCGWAGLGFKRLAILDLSDAGHQPMITPDGRYVIVFNGEVYNFKELRAELESIGTEFHSDTDTEVVLRCFEAWGRDALKRFVGMFAFVILDTQTQITFIARDHLGIKPLYIMRHDGGLHVASEVKAFQDIKSFALNEDVLYEQLSFGYVAGTQTLFEGVEKVAPGSILTIQKNGKCTTEQFYDVTLSLKDKTQHAKPAEIQDLLDESIKAHTISDVGYNIQLSGGVDSSYITAYLVSNESHTLDSYSVTIDGTLSEEKYQKEVVDAYPTNHHSYHYNSHDLADSYIKATWHMDAPNMHLASPFLMILCEESRKTSKVILTGEGADELFGGYARFNIPFAQRIGFKLYQMKIPEWLIPNLPKIRALKPYLREHPVHITQRLIRHDRLMNVVSSRLKQDISYRNQSMSGQSGLENMMFANHQKCYLLSLLERQDKVSMAASVEARVPFCSHPLFDKINPISAMDKLKDGTTKSIFKAIAQRFFSDDFVHRRKSGFTLPIDVWLRDEGGMGRFLENLTTAPFVDLPFFNHAYIQSMVKEHKDGTKNWHKELMILINFDIWYQLFIAQTLKSTSS
ncbi:MAG: asparagine synthase (glutamine-hydrolyzing) [Zetaproteobacteria bacterium]|nr:MAG: asparagine synthase (glutamine-hydrolyzing) [Zetaproteobacteria bacterium]